MFLLSIMNEFESFMSLHDAIFANGIEGTPDMPNKAKPLYGHYRDIVYIHGLVETDPTPFFSIGSGCVMFTATGADEFGDTKD